MAVLYIVHIIPVVSSMFDIVAREKEGSRASQPNETSSKTHIPEVSASDRP